MTERDFTVGGKRYKLNKVDAFKQFHIVRRLGPILGEIIPVAQRLKNIDQKNMSEEQQFDSLAKLISPIMDGLSKLSDEDANIVLLGLCSAVEMEQSTGHWSRVVMNGQLMFQDLELPTLLQIAGRSFMFNLSGFFTSAPQVLHGVK